VLEGLRGEAEVDGLITSDSLKSYVIKRTPELDKNQTPWVFISGSTSAIYTRGSKRQSRQTTTKLRIQNDLGADHNSTKIELSVNGESIASTGGIYEVPKGEAIYSVLIEGSGFEKVSGEGFRKAGLFKSIRFEFEFNAEKANETLTISNHDIVLNSVTFPARNGQPGYTSWVSVLTADVTSSGRKPVTQIYLGADGRD
jgi:hypothetical protein